jgi:hypothetical protein
MSTSTPPPSASGATRLFDPTVLPIIVAAVVLVGAVVWLLGRPPPPPSASGAASAEQVGELRARLEALEGRPAPAMPAMPAMPDLAPLDARIAALQRELAARPPVDTAAFAPRAAVEGIARDAQQRQATTEQAIAGFAQRVAANETALAARTQLLEAQAARIAAIEQALAGRIAALEAQMAQQTPRLSALEGQAQRLAALESRAARLAVLEAARAALESGRPLGAIPGAPEALARFANAAPPTEAALRLAFEDAARAGRAASEPPAGGTMMDSAMARLSGLVTVRRGEEILFGDAAGAEIERARRAIEAGDPEAALRHLARLSPAAREAMRAWIGQAESLVAARAALRQLASG